MIKVDQTILHDPKKGKYGNCAQACYASLFELPINDVPHFGDGLEENEGDEFNQRVNRWLYEKGLSVVAFRATPDLLEGYADYLSKISEYHLITGRTERGTYHVVVGKNGECIHDPHPSKAGLLPPTDKESWYFELIVLRNPSLITNIRRLIA